MKQLSLELLLLTLLVLILATVPYLIFIPLILWYFVSQDRKQQSIDDYNSTHTYTPQEYITPYMPYELYQQYLKSSKWKILRLRALQRDSYTCQHCKTEGDTNSLHVHHLTYKRLGDEHLDDLLTLCPTCHKKVHSN